jgi:hypothetical protein
MQKKWLVLNILVLIIVVLILVWIVWNFSFGEMVLPPEECVAVNKVANFVYDACYDAYSKNIFLEAKRSLDSYKINALEISFFDIIGHTYKLTEVPNTMGAKAYKIPAEKNPQNIDVSLSIVKDFSAPICEEPRSLFVRYCPLGIQEEGINVSISPLDGVDIEDFIPIKKSPSQDSDVLGLSLVDKERVWKSQCESRWECGAWGSCDNGVQGRECKDVKNCFIPTDVPNSVQRCDGSCVENWECEWSDCRGGITTPDCEDLAKCGTSYDIPQKLECGVNRQCVPDIKCSDWTSCEVDYDFMDLVGGTISELGGIKSRVCVDNNNCANSKEETRACSVDVDIYTKRFSKCGEDFIGVYNRLDNDLIARISEGSEDAPFLNINLDDGGESPYCDYCFDGRLSGDEEGVDCGGSCEECVDKYQQISFKKSTVWDKISNWIKHMLT